MKRLALASIAILALTAPTLAAGSIFIPIGPPIFTPQPDLVEPQPDTITPQAPTITKSGGGYTGSSSEPHIGPAPQGYGEPGTNRWYNAKCDTIADVNADCVPRSLHPGHGGMPIPVKTTVTANPDIVTPNPDKV